MGRLNVFQYPSGYRHPYRNPPPNGNRNRWRKKRARFPINCSLLESGLVSAIGSWSPTRPTPGGSCSRSLTDSVIAKTQVATPSRSNSTAKRERLIIFTSAERTRLLGERETLCRRANRCVSGLHCASADPACFAETLSYLSRNCSDSSTLVKCL